MVPSIEFQQKLEAALCCNLFLLGAQGAEGAQQLEFSEKLFRSKNNKALELILYHCHSVIKGKAAAKKLFNRVWPISDKDTQQRKDFYKRAETWLKESGHLEHHGNSLQQLVRNPFGFKVVSFLCDLTHCALKVQHERMFPSDIIEHADVVDDSLLLALAEPLLTAARAENQLQVERMLRLCQEGAALQQQAEEKAGTLRDLFYSLTAQLKEARAACETTLPPEVLFALLEGTVSQGQGSALGARHPPPPTQLPSDVREQQQQLQQLWAQLEGHIQEFDSLAGLVQGLAGSDVHPHAIDGAALRAAGQLPGAHSTAGLDIAAMMEAWLVDVGAVCRYIRYLAGQPDADLAGSADVQQPGTWGSAGGSAAATGSRGSGVCPLVATSDASSHAPHLYAQLEMHRNCLDHMRSMQSAINQLMAAEGKRIQQLEPQVYGLMAAQQDQCMEAASVMGAAGAAGQHDTFQFDSMQQGPAKGQAGELGAAFGVSRGGLFGGGSLQLVPPTPMLQQMVQKQQHGAAHQQAQQQQQQQEHCRSAAAAAAGEEELLPGRLSFGNDAVLAEPGSSSGSPPIPAAAVAGMVDSPRLQRTCSSSSADRACDSPGSSVSSRSLPAAALLMSQDIMDLDLVDLDVDDDLIQPTNHAVMRAASDPMRLSILRMSMPTAGLAASLTAAARAAAAAGSPADVWCGSGAAAGQQAASGGSPLGFSLSGLGQLAAGQAEDDTPPHVGHAATAHAAPAAAGVGASDDGPTCGAADEDCDDMLLGSAAAGAVAVAEKSVVASAVDAAPSLPSSVAAAAQSEDEVSPLVIEAAHLDPMGPVPGSDMSSAARPRRLTFAAAANADSPSLLHDYSSGVGSPTSSGGSVAQGCDSAASSEQRPAVRVQEQAPGQSLSLLRQRFAKVVPN